MAAQILIIEDEPDIQELLSINLTHAGHEVRVVGDAEKAYQAMDGWMPDLILLDWMLPGVSGLEFTRILRADPRSRDVPIIILSARIEERDKIAGLEAGADDYITKPFSSRELIARISVILRRRVPQVSSELVRVGPLTLDPSSRTATAHGRTQELGATEFRLLHFMVTHTERVYSRPQLILHVWGADYTGDDRTVDVHISRLRHTLGNCGLGGVIRTVRGSGYGFSLRN